MAFSLATIRKKVDDLPPVILLYGVAGIGKTSLAAEFPNAVFAPIGDGERAPTGVDVDTFPEVHSFDDMLGAIGALYSEDHGFQTLAVDSLGALETLIQKEACRRNNWANIEEPGFGKGYVAAELVWQEFVDGVLALRKDKRMNVVLIGHCDISRFDSPTTDPYSRYRINLHKKAADLVESNCDVIAFLNYKASIKKVDVGFNKTSTHAEGGGTRFIHVEERPGFIAKNRYNMPPEIQYRRGEGYNALAKYFPAPAAAEAA
jgi:hypothetical protein